MRPNPEMFLFPLEFCKTLSIRLKLLLYLSIQFFSLKLPIKSWFQQIILNKYIQDLVKRSTSIHLSSFSVLLNDLSIVLVESLIFPHNHQSFVFDFLFRFYLSCKVVSFLQPPVFFLQFYMLL